MTLYFPQEWSPTENDFDFVEYYNNHEGTLGNYLYKTEANGGTVTENAATHQLDLDSGLAAGARAIINSRKVNFTIGIKPLILNIIVDNFSVVAGSPYIAIGFTDPGGSDRVSFEYYSGSWQAGTYTIADNEITTGLTINDGDLLTIKITLTKKEFYINQIKVAQHISVFPTGSDFYLDIYTPGTAANQSQISIDYIDIKIY